MQTWSVTVRVLLLFFLADGGTSSTFSVAVRTMPPSTMKARLEDNDVYFSCSKACQQQKDESGTKLPPDLPWCERGAPYVVKVDRDQVARIQNSSSDLPPVYAVKSEGTCEREVKIVFLPNSETSAELADAEAEGHWDGLTGEEVERMVRDGMWMQTVSRRGEVHSEWQLQTEPCAAGAFL